MMPLALVYHDVNQAYSEIQFIKEQFGLWEETRNGKAFVFQAPVIVEHTMPYRRVLFDPARNANPFFHYMEAIWMLTGGQDVKFPALFAKNIKNYSDDGWTLFGAYGHRWVYHFEDNQIEGIIEMLKKDPNTRRAVIGMWDPTFDLGAATKDLPCNTHIYFRVMGGRLTMTVCNRSNDLVWGMLGSNIVHFSILQEYIANACDLPIGSLYQFTNNLHVYEGWTEEDKFTYHEDMWYTQQATIPRLPFSPDNLIIAEAADFCENLLESQYTCKILKFNAVPMLQAWSSYKADDLNLALHYAKKVYDADWQRACVEWLERVVAKKGQSASWE
jgi:thymidylate synthase